MVTYTYMLLKNHESYVHLELRLKGLVSGRDRPAQSGIVMIGNTSLRQRRHW